MGKTEGTIKAYDFLQKHGRSGRAFTVGELAQATGWSDSSVRTYLSKKLGELVEKHGEKLRAKAEILRFTRDEFLGHMTQVKPVFTEYRRRSHELITYEFFLPLTREDKLRRALDALFYSDTIEQRVREIGLDNLTYLVPRPVGTADDAFVQLVVSKASQIAGGYSISHASGRFRAAALLSRAEVGKVLVEDGRYLVDETTAVVRFIVPLETGSAELGVGFEEAQASLFPPAAVDIDAREAELRTVRMLFFHLFVEAVVRTIDGEDEIWLVESGPTGRRLYTWSRRQR